ncbi:MAG: hypothetical protein J2P24_00305 [Streptosporangiales bacterium]|nr:hypothetical protein [Streptosporangiales bacterium]
MTNTPRRRTGKLQRVLVSLPYIGYILVGVVVFLSPAQSVEDRLRWGAYAWASLFVVGGAVGAYGAWARRWVTERWGSGLVIVSNAVYTVSLVATFALQGNVTALVLALLFLILIAELAARQHELTQLAQGSAAREREPR